MPLFDWRSSHSSPLPSEESAAVKKPTLLQSLTGTGDAMKTWNRERQQIKEDYFRQQRQFHKEGHKRRRDFEKSAEKQRDKTYRRVGLSQFVDRSPTEKEMMADSRVKFYAGEVEKQQKDMRKSFDKSEKKTLEHMKKQYHAQLRDASERLREGRPSPLRQPSSHPTLLQHFLGSSRSVNSGRRTTQSA